MRKLVAFLQVTSLWILFLPATFTFLGAASNQAVLIANHDKFPVMLNDKTANRISPTGEPLVDPYGMLDDTHCAMTAHTHLNFLGDILDFHDAWLSIGDLLLELGAWLGTFCAFVWGALVIQKLVNAYS